MSPTTSVAVQCHLVEGLNVGAGMATDQSAAAVEDDIETMYANIHYGCSFCWLSNTEVDEQLQTQISKELLTV